MMNGNLPPGVSSGDPHFFDGPEVPCFCGHVEDEHADECEIPGCDCEGYDPDTDPTDEELDHA